MSPPPVVAIDGPSGSGKGTVSSALARALNFRFLDSGAIYRLVGVAARRRGVAREDEAALVELIGRLEVHFAFEAEGDNAVLLDGEPVGVAIRSEAAARAASKVAALPRVRERLLEFQRAFRRPPGLVADGRDMGTVVFPDAVCKIFLSASAEERARRRHRQLSESGVDVTFPLLLSEIVDRDRRDRERVVAPLVPAADAVRVDSTALSIDETIEQVLRIAHERLS